MPRTNRTTLALLCIALCGAPIAVAAREDDERGLKQRVERLEEKNASLQRRLRALEGALARLGDQDAENALLRGRVLALEEALAQTQSILSFVRVEPDPINGLSGPHWIIEGANVHVRSGSGQTSDGCSLAPGSPPCGSLTGLGNLVIGYNDVRPPPPRTGGLPDFSRRTGSHNLIVGMEHRYTSFGGFVAGDSNSVSAAFASVAGGSGNQASGSSSVVGGGFGNRASGGSSSVSGGANNEASGFIASVSGGVDNDASGFACSVSGGATNQASATYASVSGGAGNHASGSFSSVSGGRDRAAPGDFDWAAGSLLQPQ